LNSFLLTGKEAGEIMSI